eukprot:scaffold17685_cov63-Phaeocystis_antarctica.AAC.11
MRARPRSYSAVEGHASVHRPPLKGDSMSLSDRTRGVRLGGAATWNVLRHRSPTTRGDCSGRSSSTSRSA